MINNSEKIILYLKEATTLRASQEMERTGSSPKFYFLAPTLTVISDSKKGILYYFTFVTILLFSTMNKW